MEMDKSQSNERFPYRASFSSALSLLSLCAFALLFWPGLLLFVKAVLAIIWLIGTIGGLLLYIWSRPNESGLPVCIAGLLAISTGFTLASLILVAPLL